MESIQTGDGTTKSSFTAKFARPNSNDVNALPQSSSPLALDSNLSNISSLVDITSSAPDIRKDVIDRARLLINDPNWLSDENLDSLASKISKVENI